VLTSNVHDPTMRRVVVFAAGTLAVATLSSVTPSPDLAPAASAATATSSTTTTAQTLGTVAGTAAVRVAATTAPRPRAAVAAPKAAAPRAFVAPFRFGTPAYSKWWARRVMLTRYTWRSTAQFTCLVQLWNRESHWNYRSHNRRSGAHGIPQAMPGRKMAHAGKDWRTNPLTQIRWGLGYIKGAYGSPCGAWHHWQSRGWY